MGLISPGGQNLQDFLELRQVLSTYEGDLRDLLWWPQERVHFTTPWMCFLSLNP